MGCNTPTFAYAKLVGIYLQMLKAAAERMYANYKNSLKTYSQL